MTLAGGPALVQERALQRAELGLVVGGPVQRRREAGAAVELTRVAGAGVPCARGGAQAFWTRRPSASSSSQPRNRGHSRSSASWATSTVPSLTVTRRSSASASSTSGRPAGQLVEAHAPAHDRVSFSLAGQPQEDPARDLPLRRVQPLVRALRESRHRAVDTADLLVGGEPQAPPVAALPQLQKRRDISGSPPGSRSTSPISASSARARPEARARRAGTRSRGAARRAASGRPAPGRRPAGATARDRSRSGRRSRRGRDHDERAAARVARAAQERVDERHALVLVAAGREDLLELIDARRAARPVRRRRPRVERARGCSPGRRSTSRQPSLPGSTPSARPGSSPARRAEDFPLPDDPTMPSSGAPTSRATISATSCSRPKKNPLSSRSNDARPLNGQTTIPSAPCSSPARSRGLPLDDGAREVVLRRPQAGPLGGRRRPAAASRRFAASVRAHSLARR